MMAWPKLVPVESANVFASASCWSEIKPLPINDPAKLCIRIADKGLTASQLKFSCSTRLRMFRESCRLQDSALGSRASLIITHAYSPSFAMILTFAPWSTEAGFVTSIEDDRDDGLTKVPHCSQGTSLTNAAAPRWQAAPWNSISHWSSAIKFCFRWTVSRPELLFPILSVWITNSSRSVPAVMRTPVWVGSICTGQSELALFTKWMSRMAFEFSAAAMEPANLIPKLENVVSSRSCLLDPCKITVAVLEGSSPFFNQVTAQGSWKRSAKGRQRNRHLGFFDGHIFRIQHFELLQFGD